MITRMTHPLEAGTSPGGGPSEYHYVRFHVTDADGRCVPDACVGRGKLCGYKRRYEAQRAMVRYRRELEAACVAGSRW